MATRFTPVAPISVHYTVVENEAGYLPNADTHVHDTLDGALNDVYELAEQHIDALLQLPPDEQVPGHAYANFTAAEEVTNVEQQIVRIKAAAGDPEGRKGLQREGVLVFLNGGTWVIDMGACACEEVATHGND